MSALVEQFPWLESVPADWRVERLKTTVAFSQNGLWGDEPDGVNDIVCVRVADFDRVRCRIVLHDPTIRSVVPTKIGRRLLKRGDLLIEKSGGGEHQPVGTVVKYDHDVRAVCSNFVARIEPKPAFDSGFLCYLHAALYALRIPHRSIKQTTGIQNLDAESYFNEPVPLPPPKLQQRIVSFLDPKTTAIDALISKKERLIELLQQKRQALITHAVTKGLAPNVPMKASGVEWIGKLPAHWSFVELRRRWRIIDCKHTTPTYVDDGYPLVSTTEVKPGRLALGAVSRRVSQHDFIAMTSGGRRPRRGDIIYSRNASLGSAAYVDDDQPFCMGQDVVLITSNDQCQLYLAHALNSPVGMTQVELACIGSTFKRINVSQIGEILVPLPPLEEQRAIATRVDNIDTLHSRLTQRIQSHIDKLWEYRQALVTAAVTGQIDVSKEAV